MPSSTARHLRTLRRYRLMFRTSLVAGALGLILVTADSLTWLTGPLSLHLPWGMLLIGVSGMLGLKVAQSTAGILAAEGIFGPDGDRGRAC